LLIWGFDSLECLLNRFFRVISGSHNSIENYFPVLVVAVGGIFFFNQPQFYATHLSGSSDFSSYYSARYFVLFALMGIEAATIPADNIKI